MAVYNITELLGAPDGDLFSSRPSRNAPYPAALAAREAPAPSYSISTRSSGSSQVNVDKSRWKRNCNELYMSKPSLTELYIKRLLKHMKQTANRLLFIQHAMLASNA